MKKTLLAILATVAMVACSNDEIVREAAPEAIGFDNAFVNNSTRSFDDPSYTNTNLFKNFAVYGFVENASLFDNVQVSGDALKGTWTYTNKQYWITGAKYSFAAIAPYANGKTGVFSVAKDAENNYVGTTRLPFSNAGTKVSLNGTNDVLYAQNGQYQAKVTGQNETVEFTFRHILSKVKFSFKNAYPANSATIKVYDVMIHNAYETATATLGVSSTEWDDQDGAIVINFGNASDDEATTGVKESAEVAFGQNATYESLNERFLIPGEATPLTGDVNAGYKVTFKVDLLINGTKVTTYDHTAYANFVPVAGNAYDIMTSITADNIDPDNKQEEIKFTVTTITDWDTDYNDTADGDNNIAM